MAFSLKTFAGEEDRTADAAWEGNPLDRSRARRLFLWFQLVLTYALLERALWAEKLSTRNGWGIVAGVVVLILVAVDQPSLKRLGLGMPQRGAITFALSLGIASAGVLFLLAIWLGGQVPESATWPSLRSVWQYLVWALMQEFILQSFFFTRCEQLFGTAAAVWVAASLFAAAHLPSPLLTTFTLIGGLFFCEMFRRMRSIYPIGVVHALMGLTIAVTMPDSVLHHMRVGIGYLQYGR